MRFTQSQPTTSDHSMPTYLLAIEAHEHEFEMITDWLRDNIWRPYFAYAQKKLYYVHFLNDLDAVNFKLRFCDTKISD